MTRFARNNLTHAALSAVWAVLLLTGSGPLVGAIAEPPPSAATAASSASADCPLRIEGRGIERLVLEDENDQPVEFAKPGETVSLPAGRYYVRQVQLTGGFHCYSWPSSDDDWITLPANPPPVVKVGAPLTPKVQVQRSGRLLTLEYELADAAGRRYTPQDNDAAPPTFTILKDGQTIGSGSFEYG